MPLYTAINTDLSAKVFGNCVVLAIDFLELHLNYLQSLSSNARTPHAHKHRVRGRPIPISHKLDRLLHATHTRDTAHFCSDRGEIQIDRFTPMMLATAQVASLLVIAATESPFSICNGKMGRKSNYTIHMHRMHATIMDQRESCAFMKTTHAHTDRMINGPRLIVIMKLTRMFAQTDAPNKYIVRRKRCNNQHSHRQTVGASTSHMYGQAH